MSYSLTEVYIRVLMWDYTVSSFRSTLDPTRYTIFFNKSLIGSVKIG